jgi:hypothetical protein
VRIETAEERLDTAHIAERVEVLRIDERAEAGRAKHERAKVDTFVGGQVKRAAHACPVIRAPIAARCERGAGFGGGASLCHQARQADGAGEVGRVRGQRRELDSMGVCAVVLGNGAFVARESRVAELAPMAGRGHGCSGAQERETGSAVVRCRLVAAQVECGRLLKADGRARGQGRRCGHVYRMAGVRRVEGWPPARAAMRLKNRRASTADRYQHSWIVVVNEKRFWRLDRSLLNQ